MKTIEVVDILAVIANLCRFPRPEVCRHYVAANLLSLLEKKGWECPEELARAIVDGEDEVALQLIERITYGICEKTSAEGGSVVGQELPGHLECYRPENL